MTEEAHQPPKPASHRLAALLGLPEPKPLTADEERAYRERMDRADADLRAIIADRRQRDAA